MAMRAAPQTLLAKSQRRGRPPVTLAEHSRDTERAAARLFARDHRLGQSWSRFFRFGPAEHERFLLHVRVAALLHDLGKANEDFYKAVTDRRSPPQMLRHEHLSALILHLPEVRSWIEHHPALDAPVITAAVLSHHLKARRDGTYAWAQAQGENLPVYLGHAEVHAVLRRVAEVAHLAPPPPLPDDIWTPRPASRWEMAWRAGLKAAGELGRAIQGDAAHPRRALLCATKAAVIVADAVASGLVREGHVIDTWLADHLAEPRLEAGDVLRDIIEPRQADVTRRTGQPFVWQKFQTNAAELGPRALVLAACGAGKTLAAWNWAATQLRTNELGRVLFLYPTRGTATEGFRDYVGWAPADKAMLLHGSARYEIEAMLDNPNDATRGKSFALSEEAQRLYALGLWHYRYFSATVDQFLGFLEHSYTSLCLLPVLADSAVVIDEVHSFDRRLFDNLVSFLREFDVPVLCMTATLPPGRRKELVDCGLRAYPDENERVALDDLVRVEEHPRYRLCRVATEEEALAEALRALGGRRQRVLWVVNQVRRCQRLAALLKGHLGQEVLVYHSRFRRRDRQDIHRETIAAFQQQHTPVLAVTTQVCEMSLDLDADVLITELAPLTALVQRFGRAHRKLNRQGDFRARLLYYAPADMLPYDRADLVDAERALAGLVDRDLSQSDLALAIDQLASRETRADGSSRFTESGYFATPGSLRDADDFTRPCILDQDLEHAEVAHRAKKPLDPWLIDVPGRAVAPDDRRPAWLAAHLGVAPGERYSEWLGFTADAIDGQGEGA